MNKLIAGIAAVAAVGLGSSGALAQQTILTFGFTDLNGQFNAATGLFRALGVDAGNLHSQGDVSRLQATQGTATYGLGQAAGRVDVSLTVTGIVGPTANGNGTITILDLDGDSLTATVSGQFIANGPAVFFNGTLTNLAFTDGGVPDTTFDGPGGGSFARTFLPAPPPYTGAIVQLFIGNAGAFFSQSFSGLSTQVSGAVVPGPASLALLGLGVLAAGRRRRR
jgi:MYXO-CTERM domain-containing protein